MNKADITITLAETMVLVNETYKFIASQSKMTDDDIILIASTLIDIIQKTKTLKGQYK